MSPFIANVTFFIKEKKIVELLTQKQILEELNKFSETRVTRDAFIKRVKRGQIPIHYKTIQERNFTNYMRSQKFTM